MKNTALSLLALALCAPALAQTVHTFETASFPYTNPTAVFTKIDGNDPDCAIGYCGYLQIRYNENPWWGGEFPNGPYLNPDGTPCAVGSPGICEWGFPNGGFLTNNTVYPTAGEGPLTWDNPGCGPSGPDAPGCTAHTDTTITFQDYGAGVVVTFHDTFKVNQHRCYRYCSTRYGDYLVNGLWYFNTTDENGGKGTAVYTPPGSEPITWLYLCGSDRHACLE